MLRILETKIVPWLGFDVRGNTRFFFNFSLKSPLSLVVKFTYTITSVYYVVYVGTCLDLVA